MKKLISIKTDESGAVVYFTHEKGVDTFNKSEIVKVDLVSNSTLKRKKNINELLTPLLGLSLMVFIILLIIWAFFSKDFTFFSCWLIFGFGCLLFWPQRNTRNNLNVYVSNRKTEKYKFNEEKVGIAEEIQKYLYHNHKSDVLPIIKSTGNLIESPSLKDVYVFTGIIVFTTFLDVFLVVRDKENILQSPIFYFSILVCILSIISIVMPYIQKRKKDFEHTIKSEITSIVIAGEEGFYIAYNNPSKEMKFIATYEITRLLILNHVNESDFFISFFKKENDGVVTEKYGFIKMDENLFDIRFLLQEYCSEIHEKNRPTYE
jgi:hypothetical protein